MIITGKKNFPTESRVCTQIKVCAIRTQLHVQAKWQRKSVLSLLKLGYFQLTKIVSFIFFFSLFFRCCFFFLLIKIPRISLLFKSAVTDSKRTAIVRWHHTHSVIGRAKKCSVKMRQHSLNGKFHKATAAFDT